MNHQATALERDADLDLSNNDPRPTTPASGNALSNVLVYSENPDISPFMRRGGELLIWTVAHCGGGAGPGRLDALSALEAWVEKGEAVATRRQRSGRRHTAPLAPDAPVPGYKGGDPNSAAGFTCGSSASGRRRPRATGGSRRRAWP